MTGIFAQVGPAICDNFAKPPPPPRTPPSVRAINLKWQPLNGNRPQKSENGQKRISNRPPKKCERRKIAKMVENNPKQAKNAKMTGVHSVACFWPFSIGHEASGSHVVLKQDQVVISPNV